MRRWSGVIAVEGRPTIDGRLVLAGALRWELPLRLVQWREEHPTLANTWEPIGSVESIERRDDGTLYATGTLDAEPVGRACEMGAVDVQCSDNARVYTVESGRIQYVAVGENPAWPECVFEVHE